MADLPRWEYIVIILCAEVILAVIITLVVCWKCRWSKRDRDDINDEKKPFPEVDDLMDDMFTKDDAVVVGHAPIKHDYDKISPQKWSILRNSKKDEAFAVASVGFTNSAFSNMERQISNLSAKVPPAYTPKAESHTKPRIVAVAVVDRNSKNDLDTHSRCSNWEGIASKLSIERHDDESTNSSESMSTNVENIVDRDMSNLPTGNAIYTVDNQLLSTHHQSPHISRESSRLTPVEFEMADLEASKIDDGETGQNQNNPQPSPLVVRSVSESEQTFDRESQLKQFNRDLEMTRSPPPSYQTATGRRTNPPMGHNLNLVEDEDQENRGPGQVRFQPLWETRLQDLKHV